MEEKDQPSTSVIGAIPNRKAFPNTQDDFNEDSRVSYSKIDGKWILEAEDGTEWEYNDNLMRWMPSVCKANV